MTTRKYKKLLMSCGVERNMAEEKRRRVSYIRSMSLDWANQLMADYRVTAEIEMEMCNGSVRVRRRELRKILKKITVV